MPQCKKKIDQKRLTNSKIAKKNASVQHKRLTNSTTIQRMISYVLPVQTKEKKLMKLVRASPTI